MLKITIKPTEENKGQKYFLTRIQILSKLKTSLLKRHSQYKEKVNHILNTHNPGTYTDQQICPN